MRAERNGVIVRKSLGLAMIFTGISCAAFPLMSGGPSVLAQTNQALAAATDTAPRIENAKLETRSVGTGLETTLRGLINSAEKPEWVGYQVDEVSGERGVCCNNNWNDGNCGTCRLEKENGGSNISTRSSGSVKLEGSRQLVVLYRLEAKRVDKNRIAS